MFRFLRITQNTQLPKILFIILLILLASSASARETTFFDGFEDEGLDDWSILDLPERGKVRDGNNWSVSSNSLFGSRSLTLKSEGNFDDNAVATKDKIINMSANFNLSFSWRSPDPNNRGPHVELIGVRGKALQNYDWNKLFQRDKLFINYGGDAISDNGSPFKQKALFNGEWFHQKSYSADKIHSTTVVKKTDDAILYFDGEKQLTKEVNSTGEFRLVLGASGTWGEPSSITFDDVRYIEKEEVPPTQINKRLHKTAFVGSGIELLAAVALNQTVFVARDYAEVEDAVKRIGLQPLGVGEVSGLGTVENLNEAFNVSKPRYFAGSREKAVYVAALAAKHNSTLTFNEEEADKDFSSFTLQELQAKFIEEFNPNHVAVVDLGSDRGTLAAYMAVKKGVLPVGFDQETSYPGKERMESQNFSAEERNRYNGVIKLEGKIRRVFERIGENRNTVFDGRYVSLLDGPRKIYSDPVEGGFFNDPSDGSYFYSDIEYGNLDGDPKLEAAVGRYPQDLELASLMFQRSLERESEKEALIAAEYLHSRWPVVLATLGGGMWDAKSTGYTFENQGFETQRLVERRAEPFNFLLELLGLDAASAIDRFLSELGRNREILIEALGESTFKALETALHAVKGLKYAEQTLEIYLEHDWVNWDPVEQQLDYPDNVSEQEFRGLVLSFLPERYGRLSQENLGKNLGGADFIYYSGRGSADAWVLPNDVDSFLESRYTGENNFSAGQVPGLDLPIIWDSSNNAGVRDAEMKDAFLEKGAATHVGFSSVNYHAYSSFIGHRFVKYGDTVGESLINAINSLRSSFLVYSPASAHKIGVREKMLKSASLYGNPEMVKDPLEKPGLNTSRDCESGRCTLMVSIKPEYNITTVDGRKHYLFDTEDYLARDLAPITPLYYFGGGLPEGSNILDYSIEQNYFNASNVSRARNLLVSHGGSFYNRSLEYQKFPAKTHRFNSSDGIEYVQAGMQFYPGGARVLEVAKLKVEYLAPVTLELWLKDGNLAAGIHSDRVREVELAYSIDGSRNTRTLSLSEGRNDFELLQLGPGEHNVEAYVYDDRLLAEDRRTLRVVRPLDIYVFAPDIHRGNERRVTAVVKNPNGFPIKRKLELKTGERLQTGFLESSARVVKLAPKDIRKISWRVAGIETGPGNVSVNDARDSLDVVAGFETLETLGPRQLLESISAPGTRYVERAEHGTVTLELETSRGSITYTRDPDAVRSRLTAPGFTVVETTAPGQKTTRVTTPQGTYLREVRGGSVSIDSGIAPATAKQNIRVLENEVSKLVARSRFNQLPDIVR